MFYGPLFTEQYSGLDEPTLCRRQERITKEIIKQKYEIINDWKEAKQNYNSKHAAFLPRMWSAEHAENYMKFTGLLDFKSIRPEYDEEQERD